MNITELKPIEREKSKIRMAAYCRVSSDSTDQLNSFAAQIRHYSSYSKEHTEYELIDIYAEM